MRSAYLLMAVPLLAGCAPAAPRSPPWLAEPGLVYCYRTLAEPDCQRRPLAAAERRLIAVAPQLFYRPLVAPAPE